MPRSREFEPDVALEKAMRLFWQKGYAETSVDDLVEATGVSRYGLYTEFGSKRELFLAAMDHYQESIVGKSFGVVEQADASLGEIRRYFESLLEALVQPQARRGCLMCNAATEVAPRDASVREKVGQAMTRLSSGFRKALDNAKTLGETSIDAEKAADFLTGTVLGISVMARSGAERWMMENAAALALDLLLPNPYPSHEEI